MTTTAYEGSAGTQNLTTITPTESVRTLAGLLRERATSEGQRVAYSFLVDGDDEERTLTYAALDHQARRIAVALERSGESATRAVLLYPPGLDFIAGLFGCFYAGVTAVPVYPPDPRNRESGLERVQRLAVDAGASMVLTTDALWAGIQPSTSGVSRLMQLEWCATDALGAGSEVAWRRPIVDPRDVALLQYTSGSTGAPRGVMVTHENILAQGGAVAAVLAMHASSIVVGWLPLYHDMGLIGTVLIPMQIGCRSVLLSPLAFLERPLRWLQALSRYGGTHSPAPNFAYDLCVRKIAPEQRRGLDLGAWTAAMNGAEPVRAESVARFAAAFEPCGFRREAFVPCYGLAEATLMVSGGPPGTPSPVHVVDVAALDRHRLVDVPPGTARSKEVVGCGAVVPGHEVVIVHPETRFECRADEVGEIWVAGPSVAAGYWGRADETTAVFGARLADSGRGPFLRTGDLGFMRNGAVVVTGRRKDVIVIRGRNHYPHDLERTAERAHPALRPGCGAAFAVTEDAEERLAIVHEIDPSAPDFEGIAKAIRSDIAREHQLHAHVIVLIPPKTLPKTSSGKVQRGEARLSFETGRLLAIAVSRAGSGGDIARWLVDQIAELRDVPASDIHQDDVFLELGIDSAETAELLAALEERVGRPVPMRLFLEYPTIGALARALEGAA